MSKYRCSLLSSLCSLQHHHRLVHAYGRNGMGTEAVTLYWTIPEPMRDAISHVCVLNACSHAGLVEQALQIYQQIDVKTDKIVTTMVSS